ncbi:MAG: hypothetical protein A2Y23_04335 [Clostridiales bacterium GWB2_37_7]|nr:MAG: hypothetical protein A2Y23_04335 [Clostridiales bacterium GWB2_37_7]
MKLKKGDIIIAVILIAAVGFWLYNSYISSNTLISSLVIEVNGSTYKKIPMSELKKEQHIHIDFENNRHIDIKADESGAWVQDVICPDKLCQKTGAINKVGQSIVCLPNKVNIYYEGDEESPVDNVAY